MGLHTREFEHLLNTKKKYNQNYVSHWTFMYISCQWKWIKPTISLGLCPYIIIRILSCTLLNYSYNSYKSVPWYVKISSHLMATKKRNKLLKIKQGLLKHILVLYQRQFICGVLICGALAWPVILIQRC